MKKISLHFHPFKQSEGLHAIEKDHAGVKRKYLKGISSGLKIDGHGERMTTKCIAGFIEQAKSEDILLYIDIHGIKSTEDIGNLVDAEVLENGDWKTIFRLYDKADDVGTTTLDMVNKLWKQINGFPPYKIAKQKGFSIEGNIPDESGFTTDGSGNKIIDEIILDGVVVVPRPAYKDSIATAVFKALGEENIFVVKKSIGSRLSERMKSDAIQESYYEKRWKYQDALDEEIKLVMESTDIENKQERLNILMDEFKKIIIPFILLHKDFFQPQEQADIIKKNNDKILNKDNNSLLINKRQRLISKIQKSLLELQQLKRNK